jgi:hypothetical protein
LAATRDTAVAPVAHLGRRERRHERRLAGDERAVADARRGGGDERLARRVREGHGPGWVSHILQEVAAPMLRDRATAQLLARVERVHAERRGALASALAGHGIAAGGDSGIGLWVPLAERPRPSASCSPRVGREPGRALPLHQRAGHPYHDRGARARRRRAAGRGIAALGRAPASTYAG